MRMDAQSVSDGQGDVPAQGPKPTIPSTRTSVSWTFVAIAIIALVIVLVFILENLHATDATFFGAHWRIPLGVDLLLAALLGATVVFVIGVARVVQLRLLARRRGRRPASASNQAASPGTTEDSPTH